MESHYWLNTKSRFWASWGSEATKKTPGLLHLVMLSRCRLPLRAQSLTDVPHVWLYRHILPFYIPSHHGAQCWLLTAVSAGSLWRWHWDLLFVNPLKGVLLQHCQDSSWRQGNEHGASTRGQTGWLESHALDQQRGWIKAEGMTWKRVPSQLLWSVWNRTRDGAHLWQAD